MTERRLHLLMPGSVIVVVAGAIAGSTIALYVPSGGLRGVLYAVLAWTIYVAGWFKGTSR